MGFFNSAFNVSKNVVSVVGKAANEAGKTFMNETNKLNDNKEYVDFKNTASQRITDVAKTFSDIIENGINDIDNLINRDCQLGNNKNCNDSINNSNCNDKIGNYIDHQYDETNQIKKLADAILNNALKQYKTEKRMVSPDGRVSIVPGEINFLEDTRVYVYIAANVLGQKRARLSTDREYLQSLVQNINFYVHTTYLYISQLHKWIPNNIPNQIEAKQIMNDIQSFAKKEVMSDNVPSNNMWKNTFIEEAQYISIKQNTSLSNIIIAEGLYAQLKMANDILIDTLSMVVVNKNKFYQINGSDFTNEYYQKLSMILSNCAKSYPVIMSR